MPLTVTFLGTGIMGAPMARNAAKAGLGVRAWNRSIEKARPLGDAGVEVVGNPGEAAEGADVLVTMLADAHATAEAVGKPGHALEALGRDGVWAQMGTLGLAGTDHCAELAERYGVPLVDAPVLGTRQPAEAGSLVVLASGPDDAVERCLPVFSAVGGRTLRIGGADGGTRLKLAVNAYLLGMLEALAHALALAEGLGLDPRAVLDALKGGPLDSPYVQGKGSSMADRDFPTAFPLRHAHKDAELMVEAAERSGLDLPMLALVAERLAAGVHAGYGDEDLAATILTALPD